MAEVSRTHVLFEQRAVDREQCLLLGHLERGERTTEEYAEQWQAAEQRARRLIAGQQMFELVADTLFAEELSLASYMQAVDAATRNPKYTPAERLHLQNELKKYIDT